MPNPKALTLVMQQPAKAIQPDESKKQNKSRSVLSGSGIVPSSPQPVSITKHRPLHGLTAVYLGSNVGRARRFAFVWQAKFPRILPLPLLSFAAASSQPL